MKIFCLDLGIEHQFGFLEQPRSNVSRTKPHIDRTLRRDLVLCGCLSTGKLTNKRSVDARHTSGFEQIFRNHGWLLPTGSQITLSSMRYENLQPGKQIGIDGKLTTYSELQGS